MRCDELIALVDLYLSTSGAGGPWAPIALGLPDNGLHEWQVTGAVSSDCYLEVRATAGVEQVVARSAAPFSILGDNVTSAGWAATDTVALLVHPNPTTGRTRISWGRPASATTILRIRDIAGRVVDRVPIERGRTSLDWSPGPHVPTGIYLIDLGAGPDRERGKLLYVRD